MSKILQWKRQMRLEFLQLSSYIRLEIHDTVSSGISDLEVEVGSLK